MWLPSSKTVHIFPKIFFFFYWATDSDESGLATWIDLLSMPQEQLSSHVSLQFSGRAPTHLDIVIENKKFITFRHCSLLGVLLILGILAVGGAQVPSCLPSGGCRLASKFNLEFWALASSSRGQILWFWCYDQLNLARHPGLEPMHILLATSCSSLDLLWLPKIFGWWHLWKSLRGRGCWVSG